MEYTAELKKYASVPTVAQVAAAVAEAGKKVGANSNADVYKRCFACLDLTSLGVADSRASVAAFAGKAARLRGDFPSLPHVASVCVFPSFVDAAGLAVGDSDIPITAVAGGFPFPYTYVEVKMLEVAMAVENGADEVDVVMNVGEFLDGNIEEAGSEIELLVDEAGEDVVLKVIIESGVLGTPENIYKAALLACHAGADFVKTSTGKASVSATPEAAVAMCVAIRDYYKATGRKVGFKAAGGVKTAGDAVMYYTIVQNILGEEWLLSSLFRLGASSLANELISTIEGKEVKYF